MTRVLAALLAIALCGLEGASAQQRPAQSGQAQPAKAPPAPAASSRPSALGNLGASNKEPIKIDADRLDVFDKEQRAVFTGNVVVVQGETTMRCSTLTVFYENQKGA